MLAMHPPTPRSTSRMSSTRRSKRPFRACPRGTATRGVACRRFGPDIVDPFGHPASVEVTDPGKDDADGERRLVPRSPGLTVPYDVLIVWPAQSGSEPVAYVALIRPDPTLVALQVGVGNARLTVECRGHRQPARFGRRAGILGGLRRHVRHPPSAGGVDENASPFGQVHLRLRGRRLLGRVAASASRQALGHQRHAHGDRRPARPSRASRRSNVTCPARRRRHGNQRLLLRLQGRTAARPCRELCTMPAGVRLDRRSSYVDAGPWRRRRLRATKLTDEDGGCGSHVVRRDGNVHWRRRPGRCLCGRFS